MIERAPLELPFIDLGENQWYEAAVAYAYRHNIMEGTSDTTFVPGKSLTRAEAVQVLYNLEGKPAVSGSTTFPDLVHDWYKPAIAWAESTGVVDGYEDGTFRPDEPVNRMEFAQMLYNYTAYKGYDLTAKGDLTTFPDGDQYKSGPSPPWPGPMATSSSTAMTTAPWSPAALLPVPRPPRFSCDLIRTWRSKTLYQRKEGRNFFRPFASPKTGAAHRHPPPPAIPKQSLPLWCCEPEIPPFS